MLTHASACGMGVEWVRSCYAGEWRLCKGLAEAVPGRYVYCDPDTPACPFVHYFGSRNYTTDDEIDDERLGELRAGSQQWRDGQGYVFAPPAKPLGSQEEFLGSNCVWPT